MTKKFNRDSIVYLDGYVYIVDKNAKWAKNTYWITSNNNKRWKMKLVLCVMDDPLTLEAPSGGPFLYENTGFWKIIATDNPSLEGVPKLSNLEVKVEKLAADESVQYYPEPRGYDAIKASQGFFLGFTQGYKAASKKKYSEEDMRRLYEGTVQNVGTSVKREDMPTWGQVLQSLTPKIVEIELETEYHYEDRNTGRKEIYDGNYPITMSMWKNNKIPKEQQHKLKVDEKGYAIIKSVKYES